MSVSKIDGIIFDYNENEENSVKLKSDMFEEFKKFCKQENYTYELLSIRLNYVSCNVKQSIIMHFVECMQSENEETIKMLCSLPKEILINRINGSFCDEDWIYRTNLKLINEALKKYDEPTYVAERNKMTEYL